MTTNEHKMIRYLGEAEAMENELITELQSQLAIAPRGQLREGLARHLGETRRHASRVHARRDELEGGGNLLQGVVDWIEAGIGQTLALSSVPLALSRLPLELFRGGGGEEKVLRNARAAAASEAMEIAHYTALERIARELKDDDTAELATSIRSDEERMLSFLIGAIPELVDAVVGAEVGGESSDGVAETDTAGLVRESAQGGGDSAERTPERIQSGRLRRQSRTDGEPEGNEQRQPPDIEPWSGHDEQPEADLGETPEDGDERERGRLRRMVGS